MKTRIYIIIICSIATLSVAAQNFGYDDYYSTSQITRGGMMYSSTVYEPFCTTTPSEQTEITAEASYARGNIRRGLIIGPEDPLGPSPIGDAIYPLLILALAFGGVIALRRKRQIH